MIQEDLGALKVVPTILLHDYSRLNSPTRKGPQLPCAALKRRCTVLVGSAELVSALFASALVSF